MVFLGKRDGGGFAFGGHDDNGRFGGDLLDLGSGSRSFSPCGTVVHFDMQRSRRSCERDATFSRGNSGTSTIARSQFSGGTDHIDKTGFRCRDKLTTIAMD